MKNIVLHFSQTPASDSSLPSSKNFFLNKIISSGLCKWFSWLVETAFFCSQVFPSSETITEISENQFWKKYLILANVTDFWASESHFLPFSQTAVNCYQWKQFILICSIFFSQSFIAASTSDFFVYLKDCFIMKFFLLVKTIFEIRGKSTFKDGPYFC